MAYVDLKRKTTDSADLGSMRMILASKTHSEDRVCFLEHSAQVDKCILQQQKPVDAKNMYSCTIVSCVPFQILRAYMEGLHIAPSAVFYVKYKPITGWLLKLNTWLCVQDMIMLVKQCSWDAHELPTLPLGS